MFRERATIFAATGAGQMSTVEPQNSIDWNQALEASIWPFVLLIGIIVFRKVIRIVLQDFAERIRHVKTSKVELQLDQSKTKEPLPLLTAHAEPGDEGGVEYEFDPKAFNDFVRERATVLGEELDRLAPKTRQDAQSLLLHATAFNEYRAHFEYVYRIIFGTQLDLLMKATQGPVENCGEYHDRHVALAKELNTGASTFQLWTKFLSNAGLASFDGVRMEISDVGAGFMEYIASRSYPSSRSL